MCDFGTEMSKIDIDESFSGIETMLLLSTSYCLI
jgi:hypothetical protein